MTLKHHFFVAQRSEIFKQAMRDFVRDSKIPGGIERFLASEEAARVERYLYERFGSADDCPLSDD
ncbi:MAG: hypothetical protein KDK89_21460 [Alphaproteobacteria bacterium]|nr:hypothetical protein [Alphaproteobacteria bacterium]